MKRFEVHLIGEEKWKEILADSIRITDTDPKEIHFEGSKPHVVYYVHALRQPVTELGARTGPGTIPHAHAPAPAAAAQS